MGLLDLPGALRRRWYLLIAGVLATAGLTILAFTSIGPQHEIRTSLLPLPPRASLVEYPARESPTNPFLRLDGMDPAVSVLVASMTADAVKDEILGSPPFGDYDIEADPMAAAPIIIVTASAPNSAEATRIRDRVTSEMPSTLQDLQADAGVPERARITLTELVKDQKATTSWKSLIRLLIVIVAAGLAGTLLMIGVVDAIIRSRKAAKAHTSSEEPQHPALPSSVSEASTPQARSVDPPQTPTPGNPSTHHAPDDPSVKPTREQKVRGRRPMRRPQRQR